MIVTTYTCDKCGHSQDTNDQMWSIGILIDDYPTSSPSYSSRVPNPNRLWCRACVESLGLLPRAKDAPPLPTPLPTLEDMVREIVREEVEEAV